MTSLTCLVQIYKRHPSQSDRALYPLYFINHIICLQVNGATSTSAALSSSNYTILENNFQAHVVKISRELSEGAGPLFGYVVFALNGARLSSDPAENLDAASGPINNTTGPTCLMTAQCVDSKTLAISLVVLD